MSGRTVKLSGNQIKAIRLAIGDSQAALAERIAVSQPAIFRLERKGSQFVSGPEVILIRQIAEQHRIDIDSIVGNE
ncbi:MAG: helix-turn-helix transcriptional regulator [Hyphomicrobiaceae bacterium]|nr:MAG: helix-turn-helix transcriptional regulator [Hyphomicrobiaceae bacterium]